MRGGNGLGGVEGGRPWRDSERSERSLRRLRDWFLSERMRQPFERSVVLEREVRAFIRFNKYEDRRCVRSDISRRNSRCSRA